MKKCTYWKKYKAIYPPKCGCDYCAALWKKKEEYVDHQIALIHDIYG